MKLPSSQILCYVLNVINEDKKQMSAEVNLIIDEEDLETNIITSRGHK